MTNACSPFYAPWALLEKCRNIVKSIQKQGPSLLGDHLQHCQGAHTVFNFLKEWRGFSMLMNFVDIPLN